MRPISLHLSAAVLSISFSLATQVVAQDAAAADVYPGPAVEARIYPGSLAPDGALEMAHGLVGTVAILSRRPEHQLVAAFVWMPQAVGQFELVPEGLLFAAPLSTSPLVVRGAYIPAELQGYLVSFKAFATDGSTLDESAVITVRVI
jgi:hypothetical protein